MSDTNTEQRLGHSPVKVLIVCVAVAMFIYLLPNILFGLVKIRKRLHQPKNLSGLEKAMLIYGGNSEGKLPTAGDTSGLGRITLNCRMPETDAELKYWLENMIWYHGFSDAEVLEATGLAEEELAAAKKRCDIRHDNRPKTTGQDRLLVLPYPGGRHPRIGFLEGAIDPQRETKFSVFTPWDAESYVVVDLPEAIWSNLGLTYLAHTHIDTIWTTQGIEMKKLEWKRGPDGTLEVERTLPNGIVFGAKVVADKQAVHMTHWMKNGTKERLTDLRTQLCVMPKMAKGFEQQTKENKVHRKPYIACRSEDGKRWIITAWEACYRTWDNPDCPCFHSDPQFPDLEPGEKATLHGWFSFYEGEDIDEEIKQIEATGWRKEDDVRAEK